MVKKVGITLTEYVVDTELLGCSPEVVVHGRGQSPGAITHIVDQSLRGRDGGGDGEKEDGEKASQGEGGEACHASSPGSSTVGHGCRS